MLVMLGRMGESEPRQKEGAMESVTTIIDSHPKPPHRNPQLPGFIQELMNCETTCTICADACLSEQDVQMLSACIALNVDCADVCAATARLASRVGHHNGSVMRHQVEACREICRLCAEECERHEHEHCKICAQSCRACEDACSRTLQHMMSMA
jgi:hypothetical protein